MQVFRLMYMSTLWHTFLKYLGGGGGGGGGGGVALMYVCPEKDCSPAVDRNISI